MNVRIEGGVSCALPNIEIQLSKIELGDLVTSGELLKQLEYWKKPLEGYLDDSGKRFQRVSIVVEK